MKQIKAPIFVTGNLLKVEETSRYLGINLPHQKLDLIEMQSLDVDEVVRHKAQQAFDLLKVPVLVEDTGLRFEALGGKLPGTLIKWFLEELKDEGMCRLLDGRSRNATASATYALHDGDTIHVFTAEVKGTYAMHPAKARPLGWATPFVPNGHTKTWSEMDAEEYDNSTMRNVVLQELRAFLEENYSITDFHRAPDSNTPN